MANKHRMWPRRLLALFSAGVLGLIVLGGPDFAAGETPENRAMPRTAMHLPVPARIRAERAQVSTPRSRKLPDAVDKAARGWGLKRPEALQIHPGGPNGAPAAIYCVAPGSQLFRGGPPRDEANRFLAAFADVYGLNADDLSGVEMVERPGLGPGRTEVVIGQTIAGRHLFGARLRLHLGSDGSFIAAVGTLYGGLRWAGEAQLTSTAAAERVRTWLEKSLSAEAAEAIQVEPRVSRGKSDHSSPENRPDVDPNALEAVAYPLGDVAHPAWVAENVAAPNGIERFDIVVDGLTGEILEVIALTAYAGPQGLVFSGPTNPQPSGTPGQVPPVPNPPAYVARTVVPFVGNPTIDLAGWVSGTELNGNNAQVREFQAWDGYWSSLTPSGGNAISAAGADFQFTLNLGAGQPDIRTYPQATGTNLFYIINFAHDFFYPLGFDEAHGNFQVDNFGRGGTGSDPVLAFAQLGSGTPGSSPLAICNAWMSTPSADGTSPTMAAYICGTFGSAPNQYYTDASLDPEVVLHEFSHGVTGRLGPYMPYEEQSGAINEGNSDFLPLDMMTPSSAPLAGAYPVGTYFIQDFTNGIRNYPYSTNMSVDPLTYANFGTIAWYGPEVHDDGEIWAVAMWEIRAALITTYGYSEGRSRSAQLLLDALQLAPDYPTMVDLRDALLAADQNRYAGVDLTLLWAAFAKRALGFLAAGGFDGWSTHVLADTSTPTPAAQLELWETSYYVGETVRLIVGDSNTATAPVVTLTTSSGDSETTTATPNGPVYAASIASTDGTVTTEDGVLQLHPGDTLTATTTDSNTGGETPTLTDTAVVHAPYTITTLSPLFDSAMATTLWFTGDDTAGYRNLPFTFRFYGVDYTSVWVSSNGLLTFGAPQGWYYGSLSERPAAPAIAAISTDLISSSSKPSEGVFYYSGLDRFTVRWTAEEYGTGQPVNVAVTLFPDGSIRLDYGPGNTLTAPYHYATVGLIRGTETFWQSVPGYDNAASLDSANSVLLTPTADCSVVVTISGPTDGGCTGTPHTLDAGAGYSSYQWSTGETTQTISVTESGTYAVRVTDGSGCSGVATHAISYTGTAPVITGDTWVCQGGAGIILDAGAGYSSYQWSKGGVPIPGATSQTLTVTTAGSYAVTVSAACGSVTSAPHVVTGGPLTTPVISGPANLCAGATITLETSAGYDSYQWYRGGVVISGAMSRTLSVSATGSYTVAVSRGGCTASSAAFVVGSSCSPSPKVFWVRVDDRAGGNGNRTLDPGESVLLDVTLVNAGPVALTGINATLSSGVSGVTITQPASAYPDLDPWRTGTNSTHFAVMVAPSVACGGTSLGLTLGLSTTQGAFNLPLNLATPLASSDWAAVGPVGPDQDNTPATNMVVYDTARSRLVDITGNETWEWDGAFWTKRVGIGTPYFRYGSSAAYDPIGHRTVVISEFWNGDAQEYQTWEYDGTAWTQRSDVTTTPWLWYSAMTFDWRRGRVVAFGGYDASWNYTNQTWEYDGAAWSAVTTAHTPPARGDHGLTFDPARGLVLLAGGYGDSGVFADAWEYDGADWTPAVPLPWSTWGLALVYSPLHGGVLGIAPGTTVLLYDGSAWTTLPDALPDPLGSVGTSFDAARQRVEVVSEYNNNLYESSGAAWSRARAEQAPGREAPAVAYDPVRKVTVLAGGYDYYSFTDTWEYDGASWRSVDTPTPAPWSIQSMVFDQALGKMLAVTYSCETWTYDGINWVKLSPAAAPLPAGSSYRYSFGLAYDGARAKVVLFGGVYYSSGSVYLNDTWEFNGSTWSKIATPSSPPPRDYPGFAYDPVRHVTVLYAGEGTISGSWTTFSDTWEYNGSTWTQALPSVNPGEVTYHRMVFDSTLGALVAYGGWLGYAAWTYDGVTWSPVSTVSLPDGYWFYGLAYDSDRDRLIVTNGANTWELNVACAIYCSSPSAPVVTAPAVATSGIGYSVTWTATSGDSTYELQESMYPSFVGATTILVSGTGNGFSHTVISGTTYYYRVRAKVMCKGSPFFSSWSATRQTIVSPAVAGARYYKLTPCRVLDTRSTAAPILAAGSRRVFTVAGTCGVPTGAKAIVSNLTVVGAGAQGELKVIGGHLTATTTSSMSFGPSRARANNAIVQLATDGSGTISVINNAAGTVHFILDVTGYLQ